MKLKLLVIRTADPKRLAEFYSLFNLAFTYHRHGNSPMHYGAAAGRVLLEIYPLSKNQRAPDLSLRTGFKVDNFDETIMRLRKENVVFDIEPAETEFGFMAVVVDPDGRKIELYK
jgi:lactoylglutathione lyase